MDTIEERIKRFLEIGSGSGSGYGYGDGDGYGSGYGDGYGDGSGYGDGYGSGYGDGYGLDLEEFDGHKLHDIDGVPTAITAVLGNYAEGFTIKYNAVKVPCFIARVDNSFAHGDTLRNAQRDAERKAFQAKPVEQRIADTVAKYPDIHADIPNSELFELHNALTGSCEFGRRQFCESHGISLDGSMTMERFIEITSDAYGGEIIKKLKIKYR